MTAFATHGDLLKLLYAAFGVLPRKEAGADDFDETSKKNLQTRLSRLARESGALVDNYRQAVEAFRSLMAQYLPTPIHMDGLGMVLGDLDAVYGGMIREEGTYLDRRESLKYFISIKAVPNFVIALNRSLLLCHACQDDGLWDSDPFWYLPTRTTDGRLTMPLAKAMRWAYAYSGCSQRQFHYPRAPDSRPAPALEQNLGNAVRWIAAKRLPSLPALLANFQESFAALQAHDRAVDPARQRRILTTLVFARLATYLATTLRDECGDAYLEDVCAQIRQLTGLLQHEVQEFVAEVAPHIDRKPPERFDTWLRECLKHEQHVRRKVSVAAAELLALREAAPEGPFDPRSVEALTRRLGRFAVHANLDCLRRLDANAVPQGFAELLFTGRDLRRSPDTTMARIDEFERLVHAAGLQEALCWLAPWLRGAYYYRREDFAAAFSHYKSAFHLAKYRAGSYQYTLVNQYVELACKNDDEVAIRQGVDWAAYIGEELRWLRDKEPTQVNLGAMRFMMKKANYAHQL